MWPRLLRRGLLAMTHRQIGQIISFQRLSGLYHAPRDTAMRRAGYHTVVAPLQALIFPVGAGNMSHARIPCSWLEGGKKSRLQIADPPSLRGVPDESNLRCCGTMWPRLLRRGLLAMTHRQIGQIISFQRLSGLYHAPRDTAMRRAGYHTVVAPLQALIFPVGAGNMSHARIPCSWLEGGKKSRLQIAEPPSLRGVPDEAISDVAVRCGRDCFVGDSSQ